MLHFSEEKRTNNININNVPQKPVTSKKVLLVSWYKLGEVYVPDSGVICLFRSRFHQQELF